MADPTSLPKWVQTTEMLIRDIAAGRLISGERLPPEREMSAELGISVGTLRKALADLEERGMLERRQGSGNYIRATDEAVGVYALFRLELVEGGGLPTAEILDVARLPKPKGAPRFGPAPKAHRVRRLRKLGGRPAAIEEIWLDAARADVLRPEDLSESLYLFYRKSLNLWISRAEDRVGIATVPCWAEPPFALAPGTSCGFIERIAHDQTGAPVEYSRTWYDANVARYVARLK